MPAVIRDVSDIIRRAGFVVVMVIPPAQYDRYVLLVLSLGYSTLERRRGSFWQVVIFIHVFVFCLLYLLWT